MHYWRSFSYALLISLALPLSNNAMVRTRSMRDAVKSKALNPPRTPLTRSRSALKRKRSDCFFVTEQGREKRQAVPMPSFIADESSDSETIESTPSTLINSNTADIPPTIPSTVPQMRAIDHTPDKIKGTRYTWKLPSRDPENSSHVQRIMNQLGCGRAMAQTLATRALIHPEEINNFIHTSQEKDTHDPALMLNAQKTVSRITQAIDRKESILICGDYDVDGMTSTALLLTCLRPLGARINHHIPHRINDGYGIKPRIVELAAERGYKLIITVDNGTTAFAAADKAKELGIDLIITDHHLPHDGIPDAYALVNPSQEGCQYPFKGLAGVGVAFKLMQLLYHEKNKTLPPKVYELMMLGTVADVVPLEGENRHWVREGLKLVSRDAGNGGSPSFAKLRDNANIQSPRQTSLDIAFGMAPQLNALGRLHDANLGVRFLMDESDETIEQVGNQLAELNKERKKIQARMHKQVKTAIQSKKIMIKDDKVIIYTSPDFHAGVNGLVASKLVEQYHHPAILFQEVQDENGQVWLKGSGRSFERFNLFQALEQCKDLFEGWGGHAVAAGMMLKKENLPELKRRLAAIYNDILKPRDQAKVSRRIIDTEATFDELDETMINDYMLMEPFGSHNPQPALLFKDLQVAGEPSFMGRLHVKCALKQVNTKRKAKFFFRPDLYYRLKEQKQKDQSFDLIGHPHDNYWDGTRSIEVNAVDISIRDQE